MRRRCAVRRGPHVPALHTLCILILLPLLIFIHFMSIKINQLKYIKIILFFSLFTPLFAHFITSYSVLQECTGLSDQFARPLPQILHK